VNFFFVFADLAFFVEPELSFFVTPVFRAEGFLGAAFFVETAPFLLGFEEVFTAFPFFAAPEPLEEEAGLDFLATDFFFEAFFIKVLGDAFRTGFFLAMQSPFYLIIEKYNQVDTNVSLKKK